MSAGSISIRFGPSRTGPPAGAGVWFVFGILFLLAAGRGLRRVRLWVEPWAAAEADGASPARVTHAGTTGAAAQAIRAAQIISLICVSSRDGQSPLESKVTRAPGVRGRARRRKAYVVGGRGATRGADGRLLPPLCRNSIPSDEVGGHAASGLTPRT
jgi:hypothetical protein